MTRIIKPPQWCEPLYKNEQISLFLAGSIEMGKAEEWQNSVINHITTKKIEESHRIRPCTLTIFNPRRDDWDSSLEQSKHNPKFVEQVEWELRYLTYSDYVFMYFQPGTLSPITLLELGLVAPSIEKFQNLFVVCPDTFWRKGNVDVTCNWFDRPVFQTIDEGLEALLSRMFHI